MNEYDKYSLEELEYMHKEISEIDKEITHLEGKFKDTANKIVKGAKTIVNATKNAATHTKNAVHTLTHKTMKTNYLQKLKETIEKTVHEKNSKKVRVLLHADTLEIEFFETGHWEIAHKKIVIKQTGKNNIFEIHISNYNKKTEKKIETYENTKTMIAKLVLQNL